MTETVIFEREGPIGRLRLNRPAKLNAQTPQMWAELRELGRTLRDERDLRCLVVSGEGRAFSSGIDLAEITGQDGLGAAAQVAPGAGADRLVALIRQGQEAFSWLVDAPFASIAALRGYALGAGLQLALACDTRIAARATQLGALEFRYGLLPDLGGTAWLPRLIGPARAKELVFTAARIDAEEALRVGLVSRGVAEAALAEPPARGAIAAFLDGLPHGERVAAITDLSGPRLQARLYAAVSGAPPVTLADFVPPDAPPLREVIFHGKNSLPAFTLFQKRFCRPPRGSDELWGYNHQALAWLTGPGYFVVHDDARGAAVDYREVPPQRPPGWPEVKPNDRRFPRLTRCLSTTPRARGSRSRWCPSCCRAAPSCSSSASGRRAPSSMRPPARSPRPTCRRPWSPRSARPPGARAPRRCSSPGRAPRWWPGATTRIGPRCA